MVKCLDNSIIYSGNHNNDTAIVEIRNKGLYIDMIGETDETDKTDETDLIENFKNIKLVCNNDRFYKYDAEAKSNYEILVICPAKNEDCEKYCQKEKTKIFETPYMYHVDVYPKIIKQDLSWIDNIINGISESEKVVYNDDDIVFLPDLKWTNEIISDMYYLVIFKNKNLKSIRDLNQDHLPLLGRVKEICINKIKELHNINANQLRLYFHYYPSFWQLHLHINLITKAWHGALIDNGHQLSNVMTNIKLVNDYYQKVDIEICINA